MNFREVLEKISTIQQMHAQSRPLISRTMPETVKEIKIAQARQKGIEAQKLSRELLESFNDNPVIYASVSRVLKSIYEPVVTGAIPDMALAYGDHFNPEQYEAILALADLAYQFEHNGVPTEHALKLHLMLGTFSNVLKYLKEVQSNLSVNVPLVHDASLFILPSTEAGNFEAWKVLAQKLLPDNKFRRLLAHSEKVKELIDLDFEREKKENASLSKELRFEKNKKNKIKVREIADTQRALAAMTKEYKLLHKKHGNLTDIEYIRHDELIGQISELQIRLSSLYAGIRFADSTLDVLLAYHEKYKKSTGSAYSSFIENGLTESSFHHFNQLKRTQDNIEIPDIIIDFEAAGYSGYYFKKIDELDEADAARACYLGKLTNCCQSLSGEAGEPCVIHGLTSQYGGFYVLCKGDCNNPKVTDVLMGQCWVWRSKTGALVFDSIEVASNSSSSEYQEIANIFKSAAQTLVSLGYCHKVACGTSSGVSSLAGIDSALNEIEDFIDYDSYCDSVYQRVLYDVSRPYYYYGTDPESTRLTELALEESTNINDYLSILNWALLSSNTDLLEKVKEVALQKFPTQSEQLSDMIDKLNRYINNELSCEEIFSLIKDNNVFVQMINRQGQSPFIYSVLNNDHALLDYLISLGVDINATDSKRKTALMYASFAGHKDIVEVLIEQGAALESPFSTHKDLNSPLMLALNNKHEEIAVLLLNNGANTNIKDANDEDNKTLLMLALSKRLNNFADLLIDQGVDVYARDKYDGTTLMYATNSNQVQKLINQGADVDARDNIDRTPLMWAIRGGNIEAALELIRCNANVDAKDRNGGSALCWGGDEYTSAKFAPLEVIEALLDKDSTLANRIVESGDQLGHSILTLAIEANRPDVVLALLQFNPLLANYKITEGSDVGETPLTLAIYYKVSSEIIKRILDARADVLEEDLETMLNLILMEYHENLIDFLKNYSAQSSLAAKILNDKLADAVKEGASNKVAVLISCGANAKSALMLAASLGNEELLVEILNYATNISDQDVTDIIDSLRENSFPDIASHIQDHFLFSNLSSEELTERLIASIQDKSYAVSQKLINQEINFNQVSMTGQHTGRTPLALAIILGNTEVVKMILEKDPDLINQKMISSFGKEVSAFGLVVQQGNPDSIKAMLDIPNKISKEDLEYALLVLNRNYTVKSRLGNNLNEVKNLIGSYLHESETHLTNASRSDVRGSLVFSKKKVKVPPMESEGSEKVRPPVLPRNRG